MPRARQPVTAAVVTSLAGAVFGRPGAVFPPVVALQNLGGVSGFRAHGVLLDDFSGWSVGPAGDLNHDGVDDFVIGAPGADPEGRLNAGAAYVVFGRRADGPGGPSPAVIALSGLNGSNGFRIDGGPMRNAVGVSVGTAGDINGDGIADLLVGAPDAAPGGHDFAGYTYVVFGRDTAVSGPFPAVLDATTLNGVNGFRIAGIAVEDKSGAAVACAGDVNGDGINDILIGAPRSSPGGRSHAGSAFVVFGRGSGAPVFPATLELSSLDGSIGFRLNGVVLNDYCGSGVGGAGDVNGDGVGDIILGAPKADPSGRTDSGASYVVFGRNTGLAGPFAPTFELTSLNGQNGFRMGGTDAGERSGFSVAGAGDVNGDGVDDVIVGAPFALIGGAVYVVFGKNTGVEGPFFSAFSLSSLNGASGFRLEGSEFGIVFGARVAAPGDINGDGVDDIVVGAPHTYTGSAFAVFGAKASAFPASISVGSLDGADGFRMNGGEPQGYAGYSVGRAGDVNGDGMADILIGAIRTEEDGQLSSGVTYVLYGRAAPCPGDANGDRVVDFIDLNIVLSDFGMSGAALAGDLNGDGVCDFLDLNIVLSFFGTAC